MALAVIAALRGWSGSLAGRRVGQHLAFSGRRRSPLAGAVADVSSLKASGLWRLEQAPSPAQGLSRLGRGCRRRPHVVGEVGAREEQPSNHIPRERCWAVWSCGELVKLAGAIGGTCVGQAANGEYPRRLTLPKSPPSGGCGWGHGFRDSKTSSKIRHFWASNSSGNQPAANEPPKNDEFFQRTEARSWWPTISSIILRFGTSGVSLSETRFGRPRLDQTALICLSQKIQLACGEAYDLRVDRTPQPLRFV